VAAAQAALCLSDQGPVAQLTLLDPPEAMHDLIFCQLGASRHACVVENYWARGISGYGAEVCCGGVRNYLVPGRAPIRGIVDLSVSNHVNVMDWYYHTICRPEMTCGFQKSVFRGCCGGCGPCNCPVCESQPQQPAAAEPEVVPPKLAQTIITSAGSRKR
jgi:hypothetical protein